MHTAHYWLYLSSGSAWEEWASFKTTRSHSQSHIYLKDGLVILHSSAYLQRNCDLCVQLSTFYLNVHALVKIHIDALYYINIKQLHFLL